MVLNFLECSKLYDSDLHMFTLKGGEQYYKNLLSSDLQI
jgi:hypothetical protein